MHRVGNFRVASRAGRIIDLDAIRFGPLLERKPGADLQFAARRHRHRDRPELRSVHKTVGCAQIGLIQCIEGFGAELERGPFREV